MLSIHISYFFKGFIDRSSNAAEQGPIPLVKGEQDVWTCETGILPGHQDNAIALMMEFFPLFAEGDFSQMVKFVRPHKDVPDADDM